MYQHTLTGVPGTETEGPVGHDQGYQHTLTGVPEERKGGERTAEETVAENFSRLIKSMSINFQDGQ